MSGIAGIIRFDGGPVEPGLIGKITGAMPHRGPDGINHWVRGSVALGHCMLRTTPESLEETQPLVNEDASLVLVMDGRVDNWEELRTELLAKGARLRTRADAELVLRAYESWGSECLNRIDGDFALVIWDARKREAFCARDRVGHKPFTYHWDGKRLVFASEQAALLGSGIVPRIPNLGMLSEFLGCEFHSHDETLWTGVMRLRAAHRMSVTSRAVEIARYWEIDVDRTITYKRDEDYFQHYRELFAECVKRASRSHLPVAYEVSGGQDSSAVFAMADHLLRKGQLPAPAIDGYTQVFAEDDPANEVAYARAVGAHVGRPIHEVPGVVPPLSWFEASAQQDQDFPGYPNGSMTLALRQRMAARGCRAVLNGEGGDDWIGGRRTYYAEALAERDVAALLGCYRADAAEFGVLRPLAWFAKHGLLPIVSGPITGSALGKLIFGQKINNGPGGAYWLSPEMTKIFMERRARIGQSDSPRVRRLGQIYMLGHLSNAFGSQITESMERKSAGFGMEERTPMYARKFIEFALAIPDRLRQRGNTGKFIHLKALDDLLPAMVTRRTTKAEFSDSFLQHLRGMADVFLSALPRERATWVNADGLARLYQAHCSTKYGHGTNWELWSLYGCHCLDAAKQFR